MLSGTEGLGGRLCDGVSNFGVIVNQEPPFLRLLLEALIVVGAAPFTLLFFFITGGPRSIERINQQAAAVEKWIVFRRET